VFGRARPFESPNDSRDFRPFSGHDAFPSGHSTIAFALAGALGCESKQRWLPYVTCPAATVVAWSRLRDDKHWLSDVTAGAAFGWWTARKVELVAKRRLPDGLWVMVFPGKSGASARMGARF
jgi:membrane-associated phospholipid phosphatase